MSHIFSNVAFQPSAAAPTVFLPGWGFDGRVLRLINPTPHWIYPENPLDPESIENDLLQLLKTKKINKIRMIGWSMGAMLALEFAAKHKKMIESLDLIAMRSQWPGHELREIDAQFSQKPEAFLRNFYRKCFLGDKLAYSIFCATLENFYLADLNNNIDRHLRGLAFLGKFTIPSSLPKVPTRIIHGKQDIIAPVKEMPRLPEAEIEIIENAGHVVFLHENSSIQHAVRKQEIQARFSKAAFSYDNYAKVQAEVAGKLAAKLPLVAETAEPENILEIGCGTGNFTVQLRNRFPRANIVALDFSEEMLAKARDKLKGQHIKLVCAEGEQFLEEAPDNSYSLVASNGSLQWFAHHEKTFRNIARILHPEGFFLCTIFGPDSLKKLARGLKELFAYEGNVAATQFPDINTLQHCLDIYFTKGSIAQEWIDKEYESVHDLLVHIRKTGTGGWHQRGAPTLTPTRLKLLDRWFAETYGGCNVTYQVYFLQAIK